MGKSLGDESFIINSKNQEHPITIEHRYNKNQSRLTDQEVKLIHTHDSSDQNTSSESNTCIVREVPIVLLKEKRKRSSIHIPIRITSFGAGRQRQPLEENISSNQNDKEDRAIEESTFSEFSGDEKLEYIDASAS